MGRRKQQNPVRRDPTVQQPDGKWRGLSDGTYSPEVSWTSDPPIPISGVPYQGTPSAGCGFGQGQGQGQRATSEADELEELVGLGPGEGEEEEEPVRWGRKKKLRNRDGGVAADVLRCDGGSEGSRGGPSVLMRRVEVGSTRTRPGRPHVLLQGGRITVTCPDRHVYLERDRWIGARVIPEEEEEEVPMDRECGGSTGEGVDGGGSSKHERSETMGGVAVNISLEDRGEAGVSRGLYTAGVLPMSSEVFEAMEGLVRGGFLVIQPSSCRVPDVAGRGAAAPATATEVEEGPGAGAGSANGASVELQFRVSWSVLGGERPKTPVAPLWRAFLGWLYPTSALSSYYRTSGEEDAEDVHPPSAEEFLQAFARLKSADGHYQRAVQEGPETPLPDMPELKIDLRKHQEAAVSWMVNREKAGAGAAAVSSSSYFFHPGDALHQGKKSTNLISGREGDSSPLDSQQDGGERKGTGKGKGKEMGREKCRTQFRGRQGGDRLQSGGDHPQGNGAGGDDGLRKQQQRQQLPQEQQQQQQQQGRGVGGDEAGQREERDTRGGERMEPGVGPG
ncbi:unnamed protein product, partial [Discosporangium mesarthrocarpum]